MAFADLRPAPLSVASLSQLRSPLALGAVAYVFVLASNLPMAFHALPLTFHGLPLTFHALPLTFDERSTDLRLTFD